MKFSLLLILNVNFANCFHNLIPRRKIFNMFALSLIKPHVTNKYNLDINEHCPFETILSIENLKN